METHNLGSSNYRQISESKIDVVILPWGATEAHNYHLPYNTDNILGESIALEAARKKQGLQC